MFNSNSKSKKAAIHSNNLAVSNPFLDAMSPMSSGISVFYCSDIANFPHVVNTVTHFCVTGSKQLGVPFRKASKVISLCSGDKRSIELKHALFDANSKSEKNAPHEFIDYASRRPLDWASEEGLATVLPSIEQAGANGCLVLELHITEPVKASQYTGLYKIGAEAKKHDVCVAMVIACLTTDETAGLDQCSDEMIKVEWCEPEPGFICASSFDFVRLSPMSALGTTKTMVSVQLRDGKEFRRRSAPHIAAKLENRLIWLMKEQGQTLEAIGKVFGKNKTTIRTRLQDHAAPAGVKVSDHWVKSHMAVLASLSDTDTTVEDSQAED